MAFTIQSHFVVKRFLQLLIPLAVLVGLIIFFIYHQQYKNERHILESMEAQALDLLGDVINSRIQSIASDLLFLTSHHELRKYIKDGKAEDKADLAKDILELSHWKGIYDQIRYLDNTGMEIVRINFNNGDPFIVKPEGLQSKGERYYFKDTALLGRSEIFISPFDLNIERGEIETPIKPMIRFGTPVIDKDGVRHGIALINYLGDDLLNSLKKVVAKSKGRFMLLNSDGYWLLAPEEDMQWGFMFGKDLTLGKEFTAEWERISGEDKGQFYSSNGLFSFITIHPAEKGWKTSTGSPVPYEPSESRGNSRSYYWKAILHVPADDLNALAYNHRLNLTALYVILFSILAAGSWKLSVLIAKREQDEEILRSSYHDLEVMVDERTSEIERKAVELQRELSERKRIESALRESEEQIRLLMDSTAEGIYGLDIDGKCILCNPSCLRLLGYENEEEFLGKNIHALIHHTRADGTEYPVQECLIYKAFKEGKRVHEDKEILWRRDGSWFYSEYWSHPIRKAGGVVGAVVTFVDITQRRRAEDAIRDSELKYRTVFENSKDGISIYERAETSERKLIDCNPSYVRMSGRTREDLLVVEDIRTLQATENPEFDTAAIQQKIAAGQSYWGTFSWRRPDGKENYIEYEAVPLTISDKTYLYVIDRDITARKLAQDELQKNRDNLKELVKERTMELEIVNKEMELSLQDLERFNNRLVAREHKVIELKEEVNELLKDLGQDKKYK